MVFLKILAYLKISLRIQWSYRFALFLGIFGTAGDLIMFFFIDRLFGSQIVGHLAPYGVNYFSYVLVSIAFSGFLGTSLGSIAGQIRQEQSQGTLEALLATPTRIETVIVAMICWDLAYAFLDLLLYLAAGVFLFGIDFSRINVVSVVAICLTGVICLKSLSVLSAAFIIVFKKGDPVSWLISLAAELMGGVYFPVSVLPDWLEKGSAFFPLPYAIHAVELAVHQGASLADIEPDLSILALFAAVLSPLAFTAIRLAVRQAKHDGSLLQY